MPTAYIGLGSNVGNKANNIHWALELLRQNENMSILAVSSLYETEPEGYADQDWFLNVVTEIKTTLSPVELLKYLKEIEQIIGRQESIRWGPREIDLDLLLYDQLCFESPDLNIPHPRMHQRAFVLVPLAEIAPNVKHPVLGKAIVSLLRELKTSKSVQLFDNLHRVERHE